MILPTVSFGQAAVEGVDEVGGGEVAHLVTGVDGSATQLDHEVTLAATRRAR